MILRSSFHSTLLGVAAYLCLFVSTDAALAAMSIDLGSEFIKIGIVKPGVPMEIVLNKESRRKTPNILVIRNNERLFAEAAAAIATKYPQSGFQYILSLLAKQKGDPSVDLYQKRFPFSAFTFDEVRNTVVFPSGNATYNVETLLAMVLWSAKQDTEAFAGQRVKDCVITVPIFFNQAERRALMAAADIAGLNLLQLINDGSAAALNYGVFRRKEITDKPQSMMIYDVGASKTTATIVEYVLEADKSSKVSKSSNPVVKTIGVGYDRTLGGYEITLRLREHLVKVFRDTVKTSTDITTNARSMVKLLKEAERVKQVLSANKFHFAQVEGLHEEQNFRAKVTREELEEMIVDLEPRFLQPINDALAMAEKTMDQIDQFVLMGAGTRVPKIQELLKTLLKEKEIGRFLNTDEAIALGAVYQAADLSKSFKVLPFGVKELILFPIQVTFKSKTEDGTLKDVTRQIFGYKTFYPTNKKIVTFQSYSDDFEVYLGYGSLEHLNEDQKKQFGSIYLANVAVKGLAPAIENNGTCAECDIKGVKATFAIDLSGIVSVPKSEFVVDKKPTPEATEEGSKTEEGEKETKEEKKDEKKPEKRKPLKAPVQPKVKTLRIHLNTTASSKDFLDLDEEQIKAAKKILADFEHAEQEKRKHEEAMNALEGLVYDLAVKIEDGEEFAEYLTKEEKEKIAEELKRLRAWMEDEAGIATPTEEFVSNKAILDKLTAAAHNRKKERLLYPKMAEAMNSLFNESRTFFTFALNLTTTDDPVFTETELEVLSKLINTTTEWWEEKRAAYDKQAKHEEPVMTAEEIATKIRDLDREVKYLLNKMKNFKPKKKVEPKDSEKTNTTDGSSTTEKSTESSSENSEEAESKTANDTKADEKEEKEHDPSEL
ncbi:DnaK family protein [Ancylostoma caninum]|uniref:Hypoxia up-regulated protein 1 n=1 Tax=Ancylostoma caninum TaxID=29170 RepID=A0A368HAN0_ANCCA|nr:DnaK family protein [Ancylostoma caninum]